MEHEDLGLDCPFWKRIRGEPRGCYDGVQGGDFGKRGGAEQHGDSSGDKGSVEVVMMGDGLVGEAVGAW